ncbi:hypothetical protein GGX14DRAFT_433504 [Mycena pura]|uniref:Uncharacterized protein n=1 Tax=Mycena pura TaxID=153505 RepID=A0AAD6YJT6_9AGAR|nr:hypothetical protein GGX14DRAFT_433504 [Mycena pura]
MVQWYHPRRFALPLPLFPRPLDAAGALASPPAFVDASNGEGLTSRVCPEESESSEAASDSVSGSFRGRCGGIRRLLLWSGRLVVCITRALQRAAGAGRAGCGSEISKASWIRFIRT